MNSTDRRNPYVILGIPFGASEREARAGFAKAKRRLRQDPEHPFSLEDLTWALHQVEQIILAPELAFEVYRIPAMSTPDPVGVFNPEPHRLARATEPATPDDWDELRRSAISAALVKVLCSVMSDRSSAIPYETN
jgi:hypothetical protein